MKITAENMESLREFITIVRDILHSEPFMQMRQYQHHVRGSLYDHSVKTAYLCFRHHKRFRMKIDIGEFVRGAMLHDYYLYDLHDKSISHKFHWFKHSNMALQKALEYYPTLTYEQKDMIKHHMFPLTLVPPSTSAGWLLCFYDKIAAVSDRFGEDKWGRAQLYFKKCEKISL